MLGATGTPEPLGPSAAESGGAAGVNFAVFAGDATGVTRVLSDAADEEAVEYALDPAAHRTGGHWHAFLEGLPGSGVLYGYRVAGAGGWETGHRRAALNVLLQRGPRQWPCAAEYLRHSVSQSLSYVCAYHCLLCPLVVRVLQAPFCPLSSFAVPSARATNQHHSCTP